MSSISVFFAHCVSIYTFYLHAAAVEREDGLHIEQERMSCVVLYNQPVVLLSPLFGLLEVLLPIYRKLVAF